MDFGRYAKYRPYLLSVWIISASLMFAYTSSQNIGFLVWLIVYTITLIGLIRSEGESNEFSRAKTMGKQRK